MTIKLTVVKIREKELKDEHALICGKNNWSYRFDGRTNSVRQVAWATKLCTVTPNI